MTFTTSSGLVKIWGRKVIAGTATIDDVPAIYNLKEAVQAYVEGQTA